MAKKKQEGPGVFMILALVFFVLTSIILGVTTYLGFKDADQAEKLAKDAGDKQKAAEKNAAEATAQRDVNRIAMGTEDPDDRKNLSGAAKEHKDAILLEHKRILDKLGTANAFPTPGAFQWPLMAALQKGEAGGDTEPSPAPNKPLPAIVQQWAKNFVDMKGRYEAEVAARKKAETAAQAAQDATDKAKETFDAKVLDLSNQVTAKLDAMQKAFDGLKTEAVKASQDFKKQADDWANARKELEDTIAARKLELTAEQQKVARLQNPDASDLDAKFRAFDPAKMAERIGIIQDKSGTFVNVSFGTRMNLVPGQTFVVIAPSTSLVEVIEREKALEKHHHTHVSLGPRDPFDGNELVKGMIEITDSVSAYAARGRVTFQSSEIRNPIGKGDQLFNISLSTGGKEHVAYAGIIDLDGDGRPNNEEFVRILEKNNLTIDAYLDLKTGEIKGPGIGFKTKFLIVGSDAPIVGNVKKMMDQAKEKGVQLIDARMFLNLIGVKPPKNPAPPAYTTVTLGGEGEKNVDPAKEKMPPMPPAVPEEKKKN